MKWTLVAIVLVIAGVLVWYEYQLGNLQLGSAADASGGGTMSDLATAIAQGIQTMEGFFGPGAYAGNPAGSLSYRNNNPGNIIGSGDAGSDGPYAVYSSYDAGFSALTSLLDRNYLSHPSWTLQQLVNEYVNGNTTSTAQNAVSYAEGLASHLTDVLGFVVTPDTTIAQLQQVAA